MLYTVLANGDGTSMFDETFGKITGLSSIFFEKIKATSVIMIDSEILSIFKYKT